MRILFNDIWEEFDKEVITISELLELKKLTFKMRIVKINGELITKQNYNETVIRNGDAVQVLYLMSGG
jgi:sulfur carrier protein